VLDPQTLDHRFYCRQREFLTTFGEEEETVRSTQVAGLHLRREWLGPEKLPDVAACLAIVEAGA